MVRLTRELLPMLLSVEFHRKIPEFLPTRVGEKKLVGIGLIPPYRPYRLAIIQVTLQCTCNVTCLHVQNLTVIIAIKSVMPMIQPLTSNAYGTVGFLL